MRIVPILIVVGSLLAAMAGATAAAASVVDQGLQVPIPEGWTAADRTYRYDRETLWEYINGAAELFLSYGFRELAVQDLERQDVFLTVSVYDMTRPLDAFGVYEREKPDDADQIDRAGAAAVLQPPYRGLMLKDRFYVKVEIGGGEVTGPVLQAVLQDIAAGLPGDDRLPAQLAALPADGRRPGTVAFAGQAFLGLGELRNCLHAGYETDDGQSYRLFVLQPGRALLQSSRWTREDLGDDRFLMHREIPYSGVVVVAGDRERLVGIADLADLDLARRLLLETAAASPAQATP